MDDVRWQGAKPGVKDEQLSANNSSAGLVSRQHGGVRRRWSVAANLVGLQVLLAAIMGCLGIPPEPVGPQDDEDDEDDEDDGGGDTSLGLCSGGSIGEGFHTVQLQFEGQQRTYTLYVPPGYSGREMVPLVVDFHGFGSNGAGQMGWSGFRQLSDQHGFLVLYPEGVGASWHVSGCCGEAAASGLDDVGAVRAMLEDAEGRACIDRDRVYASGLSQGGGMAHHVACLAADVFAGVAPVSSDLRTDPCVPARPISQLSFRGTADTLSPYEGGLVGPPGGQYEAIVARATFARWRGIDGCQGPVEPLGEHCEIARSCAGGAEVALCSVPEGGHILYLNPSQFDVAAVAWEFLKRQRRKVVERQP